MSVTAVFVGMPGSGKTTVGRYVAAALDIEFADSDELVEEATGLAVSEIFADVGEQGFRKIEADVIEHALAQFEGILSLGGGAIIDPHTRELLAAHPVVLIDVQESELVRRVKNSARIRPLLHDDPTGEVARLRNERAPLYREVATHIISSDSRPVSGVVRRCLDALGFAHVAVPRKRPRSPKGKK